MKSRNDYPFIVVLIFASIALALVSMASMSSIRLGLNFGKDARIIVQVDEEKDLRDYIQKVEMNQVETHIRVTDGGIFILDISGIESGQDFVKTLESSVPNAQVLLFGTFGTMTKFLNNQSFVAMCLFVFVILFGVYYIARFRLAGWYLWLLSALSLFVTLLILMVSGFAFSQQLWVAFLLSFIALYNINAILLKSEDSKRLILSIFGVSIVTGLILYFTVQNTYRSVGVFLIAFGFVSLMIYYCHYLYFETMFKTYLNERIFAMDDLFEIQDSDSIVFSRALSVLLIFVLVGGLLGLSRNTSLIASSSSQRGSFLVFNRSDSATYLEVQARLNKLGFLDNQVTYHVSEQKQTWLEFDETLTLANLDDIATELHGSLSLNVIYDQTVEEGYFQGSSLYIVDTLLILVLACLLILLVRSYRFVAWYGSTWLITYALFLTLSSIFGLNSDFSWYFVTLLLPLSLVLVLIRFMFYDMKSFRTYFVESLISSGVLLLLMSLPVLVIFPVARNAEMMLVFLVMFISIHTAMGITSWFLLKGDQKDA